jgi:hypothetical protein
MRLTETSVGARGGRAAGGGRWGTGRARGEGGRERAQAAGERVFISGVEGRWGRSCPAVRPELIVRICMHASRVRIARARHARRTCSILRGAPSLPLRSLATSRQSLPVSASPRPLSSVQPASGRRGAGGREGPHQGGPDVGAPLQGAPRINIRPRRLRTRIFGPLLLPAALCAPLHLGIALRQCCLSLLSSPLFRNLGDEEYVLIGSPLLPSS